MSSPSCLSSLRLRRVILALVVFALAGLVAPQAHAQNLDPSYSSFFQPTTINGGAIFNINGSAASSAVIPTGTDTIQFGFSTANTGISITFGGTPPTGFSQTDTITGIESVYLVANGPSDGKDSVTVTGFPSNSGTITDYNGHTNTNAAWSSDLAPGANFPSYTDGGNNFGNGDFLTKGSGTNAAFGTYGFNGVALSSTATTSIFLGAHVRDAAGNTAFVLFTSVPVNPFITPEPQTIVLGCGMGLGLALSGFLARRRRLAAAAV